MAVVEDVGTPVAEGSAAEIIPATPVAVVELLTIVVLHRLHLPDIPLHRLRHRIGIGEFLDIGVIRMPAAPVIHKSVDPGNILYDTCLCPGLELIICGA